MGCMTDEIVIFYAGPPMSSNTPASGSDHGHGQMPAPGPAHGSHHFSLAQTSNPTLNVARGYLDRLAGEERRKALEKSADGALKAADGLFKCAYFCLFCMKVANPSQPSAGSKYLSKFGK
jgi:hypothetical protein